MPVSVMKHPVVLQHKGGNPHVVGWARRALQMKLPEHARVVMRRLVIGKEDAHAFFREEQAQNPLVLRCATTAREACAKFGDDHERQQHRVIERGFVETLAFSLGPLPNRRWTRQPRPGYAWSTDRMRGSGPGR